MGFFSRLKLWQKGVFLGMLFTVFIDIVMTIVLIVFDIVLAARGLPHYCYMFTKTVECSLVDAMFSRLGFFLVFFLVFGIPISIIGGMLGYIISKIGIKT